MSKIIGTSHLLPNFSSVSNVKKLRGRVKLYQSAMIEVKRSK